MVTHICHKLSVALVTAISVVSVSFFFGVSLWGCSGDSVRSAIKDAVYNTDSYKSLIKNPKSFVGKYYEIPSDREVIASTTFDGAIEIQVIDEQSTAQTADLYKNASKVNDLRTRSVLLQEGMNPENAKASLLIEVLDFKVRGDRCAAVQVLALNKRFAGAKWWIAAEPFILKSKEIPCPVANSKSLNGPVEKKSNSRRSKRQRI